ncbi:MAG: hypothetical protein FWD01_00830 [Defluviitaleaceae bacterium]|nr:hypothetical protein [Defluviitaleaceae bacterium]
MKKLPIIFALLLILAACDAVQESAENASESVQELTELSIASAPAYGFNLTRDEYLDLTLPPEVTLARGFQIINGNIHNRYGDLVIALDERGFTGWGTLLAANFSISYGEDSGEDVTPHYDPFEGTVFRANIENTAERGFHIIDGNIHDRYGDLLIEINEWGANFNQTQISPYFSVIYSDTAVPAPTQINHYPTAIDIASGFRNLPENGITTQQVGNSFRNFDSMQVGSIFQMTPQNPRLLIAYFGGDMPDMDFIIVNTTNGLEEARFVGVPAGYAHYFEFPAEREALNSGMSFEIRIMSRSGYGEAEILVQQVR